MSQPIIAVLRAWCSTGSARAGLTHGLSRMMGNHPVRFLGEGAAAMPLPYPTSSAMLMEMVALWTSIPMNDLVVCMSVVLLSTGEPMPRIDSRRDIQTQQGLVSLLGATAQELFSGTALRSGKEAASLPLPPLRTGLDGFPSSGSSRV